MNMYVPPAGPVSWITKLVRANNSKSEENLLGSLITLFLTGAFYGGLLDGLLGVAGMIIDSQPVDHSRKFPA